MEGRPRRKPKKRRGTVPIGVTRRIAGTVRPLRAVAAFLGWRSFRRWGATIGSEVQTVEALTGGSTTSPELGFV